MQTDVEELNRLMKSQPPSWYLDHQRQYIYKQTIKQPCTDSLPLKRTTYCPLPFIFWPFDCLPLELRPLITPLLSSNFSVTKIDSRYVELQLHGMRECLSVPQLVCFCFLWVFVGSTVGLFLFSMSVSRFHRWLVFVFYECLSVPPLFCFCFLWVSVGSTVG